MQTKKHLSFAIRHGGPHKARRQFSKAVSIRWTGLGTGLWDWTRRKLRSSDFEAAHTLLHYSTLTACELNSGQTAITRY